MSIDRETADRVVVKRAVDEMGPALRERYFAIRRILATITTADVRARHRIGAMVLEIKRSPDRHGVRAVPLLARALARGDATLYHCASVADAWPGEELDAVLALRLPGGEPLSWSHLLEIADVPAPRRSALLHKVVQRGLSVRHTREEVARVKAGPAARTFNDSDSLPSAFVHVRRLGAACVSIEQMTIDDVLVDQLLAAPSPEGAAIVADSRAAQVRLLKKIKQNIVRLKRAESVLRQCSAEEAVSFVPRLLVGAQAVQRDEPRPRILTSTPTFGISIGPR